MPLSFQNTESWGGYTGIFCFISTSHSSLFFWTPLSFQNKESWGWYALILFVSHHAQIIYIHKFEWVISCTYIMTLPLLVLPWFGSVFFSVFHQLFRCRECSNRYDNTNNDVKHCPTSYLLDKKIFIQIHAANLEILKE